MSKKKMCKWFDTLGERGYDCSGTIPCPKNTNTKCEIVPPKKKMVKVKAWAWMNVNMELIAATTTSCGSKIPCTILIDSKYTKGSKE